MCLMSEKAVLMSPPGVGWLVVVVVGIARCINELLLSYHRRLRMISTALELCVEMDELVTDGAWLVMAMVG